MLNLTDNFYAYFANYCVCVLGNFYKVNWIGKKCKD